VLRPTWRATLCPGLSGVSLSDVRTAGRLGICRWPPGDTEKCYFDAAFDTPRNTDLDFNRKLLNFLQVFEALNYEAFEQRFAGLAAEKTVFLIEND
jgi:hypothetical protein